MKEDFKHDLLKYIQIRFKVKRSWVSIQRNLKFYISKILESTDDYKTLVDLLGEDTDRLNEIENKIVNDTYKKVSPIIQKFVEQEVSSRPKPTLKNRFFARPSFLTGALKARTATRRAGTHSSVKSGLKINRSGNAFGMSALRSALNDL